MAPKTLQQIARDAHAFKNQSGDTMPNAGGWQGRHLKAWTGLRQPSRAVVCMLEGLSDYAEHHFERYDSPVCEDGFLGDAWLNALCGVRAMLNGEVGDLDCGTVDGIILALARENGHEGEL